MTRAMRLRRVASAVPATRNAAICESFHTIASTVNTGGNSKIAAVMIAAGYGARRRRRIVYTP